MYFITSENTLLELRGDIESRLKCSFDFIVKRLFKILDLSKEVSVVKVDNFSTRTGEHCVRFEPSDRLRRINSAIIARDINSLVVEHDLLLLVDQFKVTN